MPHNLRLAVANIRTATGKAGNMVDNLNAIVSNVKNGKGSAGILLKDTLLQKI